MTITKLGHCCLIIEINGVRFLTDPGNVTTAQNELTGIDHVIITHEHGDHFHLDSLRAILKNNPQIKIITNGSVGKLLEKEGVNYQKVAHGDAIEVGGVSLSGHGVKHAEIYKEYGLVENTGYFFDVKSDGNLFYPGDAFYKPEMSIDVLALPAAGPWCKLSEVVDYGLAVKPRIAFPVHDAVLSRTTFVHDLIGKFLKAGEVEFNGLELNKKVEF